MYARGMPRRIPAGRLGDLVGVATQVFITQGYRRTQMADVASALGVAKGTLYGYVESKQALFQLCAAHCDAPGALPPPAPLPVATPRPGELGQMVRRRFAEQSELPTLATAEARRRPRDLRAEVEAVLRELYAVMRRNRNGIELLDRCGQDHPELSQALQREARETVQQRLARYLESRGDALRPVPDWFLGARVVLETLTTWAVHIGWDPAPQRFDEKQTEDTVIGFLLNGLLRDERRT